MKDKNTAAILALFMGGIGVHKFYLGRIGAGIIYLVFSLTFIPAVLGLIDFFVLALMDHDEFNRRYNG
ncbi:MAG TPA: TM2 domain-containing protein, partial [Nannocystaceae bacterium]|nr:TM2 domain-containing protein [Nannocystaceae bacterium]